MSAKERLDVLVTELGHFPSREKAKAAIMAGLVFVDGERVDKVGTKVKKDASIHVKGEVHPYVSRGGLKLEKALKVFDFSLEGKVVIDIGASTGGFTDCALQNGAKLVYAVDVGYGQLAWKLRQDPRVITMERTNFRHLKSEDLKADKPSVAVMDVSFISIRILFPVIKQILERSGRLISLIKPQFEAGRDKVGKHGIVREKQTHRDVLENTLRAALRDGYQIQGLTFSPITGGDGNIEFLANLVLGSESVGHVDDLPNEIIELIERTVDEAHNFLAQKEQ
jgi:23S rRNA (cytidine1920-2'-O)/16S rRNA (cytidine1409-2'-O)-methyltransferase